MRSRKWTVRTRIAVGNICILGVLWIGTFAGLRYLVLRFIDASVSADLQSRAEAIEAIPATAFDPSIGKKAKEPRLAEPLPADAYIVMDTGVKRTHDDIGSGVIVYPTDRNRFRVADDGQSSIVIGRTPYKGKSNQTGTVPADIQPIPDDIGPVKTYEKPLMVDGKSVAIVRSTYPLYHLTRLKRSLDAAMAILFPVGLLIVGVYGWWSVGRALKPIKQITGAAESISAQDLSMRFPIVGHDEIAQLSGAFNRMFERLDRSFRSQSQFVSDASHEMRTPLAVAKANLAWIKKTQPINEDGQEPLTDAINATNRMQSLIGDLLELAKAEANRGIPADTCTYVGAPFAAVVEDFNRRRPDRSIAIESDPDHQANIKPEHLQRIVGNLLENAIRHSNANTTVYIRSRVEADAVVVSVEDSGEGIKPEHLARLGERFYRPDDARARTTGGTGLGLAICKSLAEMYGGSLTVKSEVGVGTTVIVKLPKTRRSQLV